MVLYPRSGFGGEIFVLGSIRFNRESIDSIFLHVTEYKNGDTICVTKPITRRTITCNKDLCEECCGSDVYIGPFFDAVAYE